MWEAGVDWQGNPKQWTEPPTIYRYDLKNGQNTVLFRPKIDFKSEDYTTEQVFYESKDGTRVPVLIGVAMLEASEESVIACILDLSERERAELHRLLDAARAVLAVRTVVARLLVVNGDTGVVTYERTTGASRTTTS